MLLHDLSVAERSWMMLLQLNVISCRNLPASPLDPSAVTQFYLVIRCYPLGFTNSLHFKLDG